METMDAKHTFVICAYKESEYLEECVKSLLNQSVKSNILMTTSTDNEENNNQVSNETVEENSQQSNEEQQSNVEEQNNGETQNGEEQQGEGQQ